MHFVGAIAGPIGALIFFLRGMPDAGKGALILWIIMLALWLLRLISWRLFFAARRRDALGKQFLAAVFIALLKYARFGAAGVLVLLLFGSIFVRG